MKRFRPLFLLLCLVACEPYEPSKPIITEEGSSGQSIRPRARKSSDFTTYLVTEQDLDAYIHYLNTIQDSEKGNVVDTTPVEHDGQTVYYINSTPYQFHKNGFSISQNN